MSSSSIRTLKCRMAAGSGSHGAAVGSPTSPARGVSGCADLPEAYPKIKIHHRTRSATCLLRSACALVLSGGGATVILSAR